MNELYEFANDVYDVLVCNTHFCTQENFADKYSDSPIEIDCDSNIIYIGNYKISITKN